MRSACVLLLFFATSLHVHSFAAESAPSVLTLKDSKVGDWARFAISAKGPDSPSSSTTIKQEIVALNAETVTIQVTTLKADGSAEAVSSTVAQRNKPYGPLASFSGTPLASGEETIQTSKALPCKWVKVAQGSGSSKNETTLHHNPEVPLGGIVKILVLFSDGQQTEQKLEAFGHGK